MNRPVIGAQTVEVLLKLEVEHVSTPSNVSTAMTALDRLVSRHAQLFGATQAVDVLREDAGLQSRAAEERATSPSLLSPPDPRHISLRAPWLNPECSRGCAAETGVQDPACLGGARVFVESGTAQRPLGGGGQCAPSMQRPVPPFRFRPLGFSFTGFHSSDTHGERGPLAGTAAAVDTCDSNGVRGCRTELEKGCKGGHALCKGGP